jgi:hypothetical protein
MKWRRINRHRQVLRILEQHGDPHSRHISLQFSCIPCPPVPAAGACIAADRSAAAHLHARCLAWAHAPVV